MIADKDDEWKDEMLQKILLGATFQASNIESYRESMLELYKLMMKVDIASAQEAKKLARHYFKTHGEHFPLQLPSDELFEDMSKIAAAAIFATRLVEVAEEGLIQLDALSKELEEIASQFQEDHS
jgi:hypothetical protein